MTALGRIKDRKSDQRSAVSLPALEAPEAARTRVRWLRLLAGVALMAASIVGVWLVMQTQQSTVSVWVARDRIEAGSAVTGDQLLLREISQGSQLSALPASRGVIDRVVRVTIPAGSTLAEGHFFATDDDLGMAAGTLGQAAVVFDAGAVPSRVRLNDLMRIQVYIDARDGGTVEIFDQVPVLLVERLDRGGTVITVEVGSDEGDRLLRSLATGTASAQIVGRR